MKTRLALAALLFSSLVAATTNTNVVPIAEANDGDRLLARSDTFSIQKNKHDIMVAGVFTFWASNPNIVFFFAINAADCSVGRGEMTMTSSTHPDKSHRYYWTSGGNRIYDMVAAQMCTVVQAQGKKENPSTPSEDGTRRPDATNLA